MLISQQTLEILFGIRFRSKLHRRTDTSVGSVKENAYNSNYT
jgi:hypothetical protein